MDQPPAAGTSSGPIDPDILHAALQFEERGTAPSFAQLVVHFPGRDAEVRTVLSAVERYHAQLATVRRSRGDDRVAALPSGTVLGDFHIDGVIGHGAMGTVYRARQISLGGREVALKVLPAALVAHDKRFVERFRREAALAAAIHHPNIAEVYGFGDVDGAPCFAMRLIEGRTLQEALMVMSAGGAEPRASPRHVETCVRLVRDLAGALGAIHARGLVHRDVKPANVILETASGSGSGLLAAKPVLVDFGLLRPTGPSDLTGSGTLLGTPAYASPEGQLGLNVDARADVFSLGAVLHDLLSATAPGDRGPASAGLPDVRVRNPGVDARLAAIVAMAVEEHPQNRYSDGAAFARELDRYLRNEPVRALPVHALGRWRLWARRNPVTAVKLGAATGLAALFLAVALAWFGLTAGALMSAAARGASLDKEGDVRAAALALRPIYDNDATARWIPWLQADRARAMRYWDPAGAFAEVVRLLLAQDATSLQLAHDRLHERLFDAARPEDEKLALRFLSREILPDVPAERRIRALETWADYLLLKPGPDGLTGAIREHLLRIVRGSDALSQDLDAVSFAISALGGMPDTEVFEVLVNRIQLDARLGNVRRAAELATLAAYCAERAWQILNYRSREGGAMPTRHAMVKWLRGMWDAVDVLQQPGESTTARANRSHWAMRTVHNIAWQRVRGDAQHEKWPELNAEQLAALAVAEASFARGADMATPSTPATDDADLRYGDMYLGHVGDFTGKHVYYSYERNIWEPRGRDVWVVVESKQDHSMASTWARGPVRARIDFTTVPPTLQGPTALRAEWLPCAPLTSEEERGERRYLKCASAGRRVVRLRSFVPPDSTRATIRLRQEKAARWPLPHGGRVTISLRVPEIGFLVERDVALDGGAWTFEFDRGDFAGATWLSIDVAVLRANTTHRIDFLEIEWHR